MSAFRIQVSPAPAPAEPADANQATAAAAAPHRMRLPASSLPTVANISESLNRDKDWRSSGALRGWCTEWSGSVFDFIGSGSVGLTVRRNLAAPGAILFGAYRTVA